MENCIATSIEQSKKLIELGLDANTANMYWIRHWGKEIPRSIQEGYEGKILSKAWSLTALLELMPKDKNIEWELSYGGWKIEPAEYIEKFFMSYEDEESSVFHTVSSTEPLDAAFEMICWLLENGYLKKGE